MVPEKVKILIIDDEQDIREYLKKMLERKGYLAFTAADGEEGLQVIKDQEIEIIFSDITMPKLNGIAFLKEVHNYNIVAQVIMITGNANLDDCIEAVEYGANAYLLKPINTQDMLDAIALAQRNITEKKEIVKKAINQLEPKEVNTVLKRIMKIGKSFNKMKEIIKDTLTETQ